MAIWRLHFRGDFRAGSYVAKDGEVFFMREMAGRNFDVRAVAIEGELSWEVVGLFEENGADVAGVEGGQWLRSGPGQLNAGSEIEV